GRLDRLRQEAAWVDPAVQLWNRPLLDNLRYGNPDVDPGRLGEVCGQADLVNVLEKLPDGLKTARGEGGGWRSGGRGQRARRGRAAARGGAAPCGAGGRGGCCATSRSAVWTGPSGARWLRGPESTGARRRSCWSATTSATPATSTAWWCWRGGRWWRTGRRQS